MLYIITEKTNYTLRFYDDRKREVHRFEMEGELEEILYCACSEWCENFAKVEVYDGQNPICIMYADGGIRLIASNLWARLD